MSQEELQLNSAEAAAFQDPRDQLPEEISQRMFEEGVTETLKEVKAHILKAENTKIERGQQINDLHCIIASQNGKMQRMALSLDKKFKELESRLELLEKLQAYDFTVEHRPGLKRGNADSMSRRPCAASGCKNCEKREIADGQFKRLSSEAQGENSTDSSTQQPLVLKATQVEGIGESGGVAQAACWENSELREAQLGDETLRDVIMQMVRGKEET